MPPEATQTAPQAAETAAAPATAPSAPAAAETPPAPAQAGKPKRSREQLMSRLDKLNAQIKSAREAPAAAEPADADGAGAAAANPEASTGDKPAAETTKEAASSKAVADAIEQSGGEDKKPGETPKQYEFRITQAMMKAQRAESQVLEHKKAVETATARVKELESALAARDARLEELKGDPLKALAHAGSDAVKIAQLLVDGKITPEQAAAKLEAQKVDLPPEIQAKLDRFEKLAKAAEDKEAADKQAADKQAAEQQSAAVRAENLKLVDAVVKAQDFADAYPLVAALPGASDRMLDWIEGEIASTGKEPAIADVADAMQAAVLATTVSLLKSESAAKSVLSDKDVAAVITKALGLLPATAPEKRDTATAPSERVEEGKDSEPKAPKTITNKASSRVPTRAKRVSGPADIAAKINAQLFGR